jgi:hypothetical protein
VVCVSCGAGDILVTGAARHDLQGIIGQGSLNCARGDVVTEIGEGERILPAAITERFTLTADGKFEALVEGSTKAVVQTRRHAGIVKVCGTPSIWPSAHTIECYGKFRPISVQWLRLILMRRKSGINQRRSVDESKCGCDSGSLRARAVSWIAHTVTHAESAR